MGRAMSVELSPLREADIIRLSRLALHRIDTRGPRGIDLITHEEIWAMALHLVLLGVAPWDPSTPFPTPPETGDDHV